MVKRLFAVMVVVCACAIHLVSPSMAFAARGDAGPTVVYDGGAKRWYGESLREQDVIAVAGDVLPGDTLTQEFELAVRNAERGVTLSMSPDADAGTLAALGGATIEVADGSGATIARGVLAEFAAAEGESLALGSYASNAEIPLRITLTIPTSVGNESQGEAYEIAWIFTAQEDGEAVFAGSDDLLVQTGDDPMGVYGPFVLGALGIFLIAAAVVRRRK